MNIRKSHQIPDSSEVKYCIFCILYWYVGLIWIVFIRFLFGSVSSGFVCFFLYLDCSVYCIVCCSVMCLYCII